ncbi:MAG: glycosyltransferase family 4 protein [Planctomycetota bacterium]|nr:glycosyltransferase family 4 protein [Planctomycetota bacterium]
MTIAGIDARPLRVLMVTEELGAGEGLGSIAGLLDELAARGVFAEVLCARAAEAAPADQRVICFRSLAIPWRRPIAIRTFCAEQRVEAPDLIHVLSTSFANVGMDLAARFRCPYVQTVEDYPAREASIRVARGACRRILVATQDLADELRLRFGVNEALIATATPGVACAPDDLSPLSDGGHIPVIGTWAPGMGAGLRVFLEAARRVLDDGVDAEFVIAGLGGDLSESRRRADRFGVAQHVTFADFHAVGPRLWSMLDLYCHPATNPTVARAPLLAMAAGIPVIASDVDGLRGLLAEPGGAIPGALVPQGDPDALAASILTLLRDDRARAELGDRARRRVETHFSLAASAASHAVVYREALARGPAAADPTPATFIS